MALRGVYKKTGIVDDPVYLNVINEEKKDEKWIKKKINGKRR